MSRDLNANEALELTRVMYPEAWKVLVYEPKFSLAGDRHPGARPQAHSARIEVISKAPMPSGYRMNMPLATGTTLRAAVLALARNLHGPDPETRGERRGAVVKALGASQDTDGEGEYGVIHDEGWESAVMPPGMQS